MKKPIGKVLLHSFAHFYPISQSLIEQDVNHWLVDETKITDGTHLVPIRTCCPNRKVCIHKKIVPINERQSFPMMGKVRRELKLTGLQPHHHR